MEDMLDIGDVARATSLSLRALRFYEARGLVAPLRTAGGRRVYGRAELARLNAAVALKYAGFSLAQIAVLMGGRAVDLGRLLAARIDALDAQAIALGEARMLLRSVQSRIDRGEPIDVATLCSLIRSGDQTMERNDWKAVSDRYLSDEAKADFAGATPPAGFDQAAYAAQWSDLSGRIAAALPLDTASAPARAFYDEWQALLAPFEAMATPAMTAGVTRMYDHIEDWREDRQPPFPAEVWRFIQAVGTARKAG